MIPTMLFSRGPACDEAEMGQDEQAKALALALHAAGAIEAWVEIVVAEGEPEPERTAACFLKLIRHCMSLYPKNPGPMSRVVSVAENLGLELVSLPETAVIP